MWEWKVKELFTSREETQWASLVWWRVCLCVGYILPHILGDQVCFCVSVSCCSQHIICELTSVGPSQYYKTGDATKDPPSATATQKKSFGRGNVVRDQQLNFIFSIYRFIFYYIVRVVRIRRQNRFFRQLLSIRDKTTFKSWRHKASRFCKTFWLSQLSVHGNYDEVHTMERFWYQSMNIVQ